MGRIETRAALAGEGAIQQVSQVSINRIDAHIGSRIRLRRTLVGMSQERLGEALGLTFQQVQKYERGVNRVGASRLFDLCRVLDVPISFFYDKLPDPPASPLATQQQARVASEAEVQDMAEGPNGLQDEVLNRRETLELVRAYSRINEPTVRKRVLELIKSMAPLEALSG